MNEFGFANQAAEAHGVTAADILGPYRNRRFVRARWDAWAAARASGWTLDAIAEGFNRDRATVIYGLRQRGKLT